MPTAALTSTTIDFGDVLFIINGLALTTLFGILYLEEIIAATRRVLRVLNPLTIPARFRSWRAAHRTPG